MAASSTSRTDLTRRSFVQLAGGACAVAALAGLAGAPASPARAADGATFTYAIAGDPGANVNAVTTTDRYGLMVLKLVYSPLWMYNNDGVNYFLAESYEESDDHLALTVHLRAGVTWNDGEPFTADDVVYTFETIAATPAASTYVNLNYGEQGRVQAEKVDDLTVRFTFPFVLADAVEMLSGTFVMPEHLYAGVEDFDNNAANQQAVGTGPYRLVDYQEGQYLQFEANEDYFLGAPSIHGVVFRIITNETTGMQAIQAGEVDAWTGTPAEVEQMDLAGNGLVLTAFDEGRVAYMMLNANNIPDERVRKAILYSFDKQAIAVGSLLSEEYYEDAWTFLPPDNPFATEDVEHYDRDLDKARQLLEEAGVTDPSFTITYASDDSLQQVAAVLMQEQAAEAGIKIELVGMDTNALWQQILDPANTLQMYYTGYIRGIDPDTFSDLFISVSASSKNYMYYEYPDIDEVFAAARVETDEEVRRDLYAQAQQMVQDTACFYPMYSNKRLLVTSQRVAGLDDAKLVPIYTFEDLSKLRLEA